jgi:acyl-CoA thioesterase I
MSICRIFILSFIALALPCYAQTHTILVMGDSLSAAYGIELEQGWVNLLHNKLDRMHNNNNPWRVINASVSGETTAGALARLPDLLDEYKPELCIIELGANDGLRGQPVNHMQEHLHEMITRCKVYGKVLLLGIRLPPNYGKKYTEAFDQSFTQLAEKNNISFVPFILDGIALHEQYMQLDGLHPTAEAQEVILENIWPALSTILESL